MGLLSLRNESTYFVSTMIRFFIMQCSRINHVQSNLRIIMFDVAYFYLFLEQHQNMKAN